MSSSMRCLRSIWVLLMLRGVVFPAFFIEDLSVVAHDGDPVLFEPPYGGRDQVNYTLKLLFAHPGAGTQLQDHGRAGWLLVFLEEAVFGQDQVNPALEHLAHAIHGPGQLSLERSLVVDFLDKFRAAQLLLIENLKPHARSFGNSVGGKGKPGVIDLLPGYFDTSLRNAVGNFLCFEGLRDLCHVVLRHPGIKRGIIGPVVEIDQKSQRAGKNKDASGIGNLLRKCEGLEILM